MKITARKKITVQQNMIPFLFSGRVFSKRAGGGVSVSSSDAIFMLSAIIGKAKNPKREKFLIASHAIALIVALMKKFAIEIFL